MYKAQSTKNNSKTNTTELKPLSTRDMSAEEFNEYQKKLLQECMKEVAVRNYARRMKTAV